MVMRENFWQTIPAYVNLCYGVNVNDILFCAGYCISDMFFLRL